MTRPGADHTPEGREPKASENLCATVDSGEAANSAHLAQSGSHGLGRDVVHPGADAGLGTREVLQPAGRPQNRHNLQVQSGDITPLPDGRLMPAGNVGQRDRRAAWPFVVAVQPPQQVEVDLGKLVAFRAVQGDQIGDITVRDEVHLDRPPCGIGHVCRPGSALDNHARACVQLCGKQIGTQQAAGAVMVFGGLSQNLSGARGQKRVGVNLSVRVVQRDADLLAAVLEGVKMPDTMKSRC